MAFCSWFPLACSIFLTVKSLFIPGTGLEQAAAVQSTCDAVSFGGSSQVCRCNATYCDVVTDIGQLTDSSFTTIVSSKSGARFSVANHSFNQSSTNAAQGLMTINADVKYQKIIGFGGAFTDAAAINIYNNLQAETRQKLLEAYYSPQGIEYTLGRIPIASTDFSTHAYSYDDTPEDLDLTDFSLAPEDLNLKIPLAKAAMGLSKRKIRLFSSPWTSPAWMKTDDKYTGRGSLRGHAGGPYYKAWANYLVKFLDAYKQEGLEFWGMTAQNEPFDGRIPDFPFQCLGFTADTQRDFIVADLGPALAKAGYSDLKLMILDDDLITLPGWAKTIYGNATANQYVSGLGIHWYLNGIFSRDRITETHQVDPSKFVLATEACAGSGLFEKKVILGSWERAESYADDIIKDLQNWVTGWTDWNIALNMSGGPNWVNNNVDSPIIVNPDKNEFYKQPMFYAMGHFSKYLTPDSERLKSAITGLRGVEGVAFLTPENTIVVELLNSGSDSQTLKIQESDKSFDLTIPPHSIMTVTWKK